MIHNKPVWAIICGAVRQEFELYTIIIWLCEQRSKGYLDGIVLSTWIGEVDNILGLRNKLDFLDINLVEIQPLQNEINNFANMNYFRQISQLNAGLNRIPKDVFVLKCRTDYCNEWVKKTEKVLSGKVDLSVQSFGSFNSGLCYKIAVMNYSISHPFILEDICFLGYKNDIRKMTVFESSPMYLKDRLSPDVLFYMSIFLHHFSIVKDFFEMVHYWKFASSVRDKLLKVDDKEFYLPKVLNKFYALYFVLLYTCFFSCCISEEEDIDVRLSDIFYGDSKNGIDRGWLIAVRNPVIISKVVNCQLIPSDGANQMMAAIHSIYVKGEEAFAECDKEDYVELRKWGEKYLQVPVETWLKKEWHEKFMPSSLEMDFGQASKILFSNYVQGGKNKKSSRLTNIMEDIIFSSVPYYKAIIANLDKLKAYNPDLYESALLAASRCKDDLVLKYIGTGLLYKTISLSRIEAAKYVFKRYLEVEKEQFIKTPLVANQIIAIFYYGKYSEMFGNEIAFETLYSKLKNLYGIKKEIEGSYEEKIIDVAQTIIELNIDNYVTDKSIESLVDFLLEVCDYNPFSEAILEMIKKYDCNKYNEVISKYENFSA